MKEKEDTQPKTDAPSKSLPEFAEEAVRNHKLASESEAKSIQHGKEAIRCALAAGAALNAAKGLLKHGGWLPWLKENVPAISEETAQRYMRLEKASHVTDLSGCESLRQAYLCCRILKRSGNKTEPETNAPSGTTLPDVSVSLADAPSPDHQTSTPDAAAEAESDEEKADLFRISCTKPEFEYALPLSNGEILENHIGSDADDLYELLKPLVLWIKRYETAKMSPEAQRLAA